MVRAPVILLLLAAVFLVAPESHAAAGFRPVSTVPRMHVGVIGASDYKTLGRLHGATKDAMLV